MLFENEAIYIIKTTDQRTKKTTIHFQSKKERDARAFFKAMLPSLQSLKDWKDIQKDKSQYTEIRLVKKWEIGGYEYPDWRGFILTKDIKK